MELTGDLKKQVEAADSKEEVLGLIEKAGMKLTEEELEMVSGGCNPSIKDKNLIRTGYYIYVPVDNG